MTERPRRDGVLPDGPGCHACSWRGADRGRTAASDRHNFDAERAVNGLPAEQRIAIRQRRIASLVYDLETWMRGELGKLSRHDDVTKAMYYMLRRGPTRFLEDGRICLTSNAAEQSSRGIDVRRRSWLFGRIGPRQGAHGGDVFADYDRESE